MKRTLLSFAYLTVLLSFSLQSFGYSEALKPSQSVEALKKFEGEWKGPCGSGERSYLIEVLTPDFYPEGAISLTMKQGPNYSSEAIHVLNNSRVIDDLNDSGYDSRLETMSLDHSRNSLGFFVAWIESQPKIDIVRVRRYETRLQLVDAAKMIVNYNSIWIEKADKISTENYTCELIKSGT